MMNKKIIPYLTFIAAIMFVATSSAQTPPPQAAAAPLIENPAMAGMSPNGTMPSANNANAPADPNAPVDPNAPPSDAASPSTSSPPQQNVPVELRILKKVEEELKEKFKADIYTPANITSLFFTPTQQSLLNSARQGMTSSLSGGMEGLEEDIGTPQETVVPTISSIFLSGIVYNGKDNWTIWLNGARVTPKTLPKEIIDISVKQEYIELKWFDQATNQIFPVRLRPNQRFDFEKKVFLPGQ